MTNIREVLRRLIKYLILVLIVAFACYTLVKNKLNHFEILIISLTSGMVYNILDIVSPTINLKIDSTETRKVYMKGFYLMNKDRKILLYNKCYCKNIYIYNNNCVFFVLWFMSGLSFYNYYSTKTQINLKRKNNRLIFDMENTLYEDDG